MQCVLRTSADLPTPPEPNTTSLYSRMAGSRHQSAQRSRRDERQRRLRSGNVCVCVWSLWDRPGAEPRGGEECEHDLANTKQLWIWRQRCVERCCRYDITSLTAHITLTGTPTLTAQSSGSNAQVQKLIPGLRGCAEGSSKLIFKRPSLDLTTIWGCGQSCNSKIPSFWD